MAADVVVAALLVVVVATFPPPPLAEGSESCLAARCLLFAVRPNTGMSTSRPCDIEMADSATTSKWKIRSEYMVAVGKWNG